MSKGFAYEYLQAWTRRIFSYIYFLVYQTSRILRRYPNRIDSIDKLHPKKSWVLGHYQFNNGVFHSLVTLYYVVGCYELSMCLIPRYTHSLSKLFRVLSPLLSIRQRFSLSSMTWTCWGHSYILILCLWKTNSHVNKRNDVSIALNQPQWRHECQIYQIQNIRLLSETFWKDTWHHF